VEELAVRILMLTQWFDPEPAFKGLQLARKLRESGHDVEVLTGFPNYPGGKLYPKYRIKLWQKELMDGVAVVRVPLYPSHDGSIFRRALNYLSFAAAAAFLGPWLVRRPDVIYAYHPPGTVAIPALTLSRWFSVPVIYDVQDLWPDTIISSGMARRGYCMRMLDRLCRFAYRRMDAVTVLSPGFRRTLMERGVAADKLHVIYNWAPEIHSTAELPHHQTSDRFTLAFAGTMGLAQGLDAVLDAAALCSRAVPRARFLFVGTGVDSTRLQLRAEKMRLSNVEFVGWQPREITKAILADADALLVHLKDEPLFSITIPSKTQAYLAVGRPIIMAVRGDAADLVVAAGAGVLAEPDNPQSIAEAVHQLAELPPEDRERMGRQGKEFYARNLCLEVGVSRFVGIFKAVFQQYERSGRRPRMRSCHDL
jgi:colanic acid biosynthesis glycosyl transferase WcaI